MLKAMGKVLRQREGFTLVELLAVLAILGILATVAVPRVVGAIDEARESRNRADLALIMGALERYYTRYGVYPPSLRHLVHPPSIGTTAVPAFLKTDFTFENSYGHFYFYAVRNDLQKYILGDPGKDPKALVVSGTAYVLSTTGTGTIPAGLNPNANDVQVYVWTQPESGTPEAPLPIRVTTRVGGQSALHEATGRDLGATNRNIFAGAITD
ncbi:MAG: prepilin-type N-terminal cleavage/methylation domain-containing protein [Bacillota bacterium]